MASAAIRVSVQGGSYRRCSGEESIAGQAANSVHESSRGPPGGSARTARLGDCHVALAPDWADFAEHSSPRMEKSSRRRCDGETDHLDRRRRRVSQPGGSILTGPDVAAIATDQPGSWPLGRTPFLLETSTPGVFTAGDVRRSSMKRVASAVGEGSSAISNVHLYLDTV